MDKLLELAARCEAAEASEQRALLFKAWQTVFPVLPPPGGYSRADEEVRIEAMLALGAYESAALTLMPEDARAHMNIAPDKISTAIVAGTQGIGNTPALALVAAALRARHAEGGDYV